MAGRKYQVLPHKLICKDFLAHGIYPETWKRANIVPVHKRIISLLPLFRKIFRR